MLINLGRDENAATVSGYCLKPLIVTAFKSDKRLIRFSEELLITHLFTPKFGFLKRVILFNRLLYNQNDVAVQINH